MSSLYEVAGSLDMSGNASGSERAVDTSVGISQNRAEYVVVGKKCEMIDTIKDQGIKKEKKKGVSMTG